MKLLEKLSLMALVLVSLRGFSQATSKPAAGIRVLIVDGQNNHVQWPKITFLMKQYLEETGKFSVDVKRTHYTWQGEEFIGDYPVAGTGQTTPCPRPGRTPASIPISPPTTW
jgi:hypothetical protein